MAGADLRRDVPHAVAHEHGIQRRVALCVHESSDKPLAPTRGHLVDHYGLSVANLDAWIAKLRAENVTILEQPYKVGDYRAVMIEGPSREAIELIEIR